MLLPVYLGLLQRSETVLADSFRTVAEGHAAEVDVYHLAHTLARQCDEHAAAAATAVALFPKPGHGEEPSHFDPKPITSTREGPAGLLRDLQDLYMLAGLVGTSWTLVMQAAKGLQDSTLLEVATDCFEQTEVQVAWLTTKLKSAAEQALLIAS
ncbi:hypothetical protein [Curtobacterium sp. ISL-83]|uniref:hypothetical protein n=1 Tax=Curtobacterium sp. ISL-83 TaxID=2819145 RepID=UPI001BED2667|nr:hypothetical protein [Curtobacterium sp. ISL-83]MBT2502865.1 hypothetical protein [Curtobacterium sp. ISL-83]